MSVKFLIEYRKKMKASLDAFKIVSWDLEVPAIPCYVVGELGPLMVFIPKTFGTLPVDYCVSMFLKLFCRTVGIP